MLRIPWDATLKSSWQKPAIRHYGLALELQNVPSKTANNFSVLVCRPVKFDMDNDYRLPYRIMYRILVVIIFGDLLQLF